MPTMPPSMANSGPPYLPTTWALGGAAVLHIDVPITAVLLFLYICGAVIHMTIFQLNRKRGHKFLFSALLFGFCMARTVTCILRIASICKPHNIRLAIAASIFVAAGVLLIFIINILFALRLLRAAHPNFGWNRTVSLIFKLIYVCIGLTLAIVITGTVQTFYTLRPRTRQIDRSLQLYGATFLAIISFLPIPMVVIGILVPRKIRLDKFGHGRYRTKVIVLLIASVSVCLGAAFRCGTAWKRPVPRTQPLPDYYSRACFYVFNFVVEVIVVYLYAILRVDLRFHIPDGAKGHGSYAAGQKQDEDQEKPHSQVSRVGTEETAHADIEEKSVARNGEAKRKDGQAGGQQPLDEEQSVGLENTETVA